MEMGIGQPVRRVEDHRLLTGNGRYTDDVNLDGQVHGHVLRAPLAHANIRAIDVAAAAARYVADDDPYLTKRRHPFEVFAGGNRINQYLGDAPAPDTFAAASAQFLERLK